MDKPFSKAERTRSFIIEQTAEIFNKKGYAGTSLSDITEATALSKGSIYGNFENKEEVALAVFDFNYSRIRDNIRREIDKAGSYHDKLMAYARVYQHINQGDEKRGGCPILNTSVEADDTNPRLKERAANALLNWKQTIVTLIENGIEAGEFKKNLPATKLALSIIALIEGGLMIAKVTGNPEHMYAVIQTVEFIISEMKL